MKSPRWATEERTHERSENRAARIAALYMLRDNMPDVPKTAIAAALSISRWTLDRDLSSVAEVDALIQSIQSAIEETRP